MYHFVHSTTDCDAFQLDLGVWCSKWQIRLNVTSWAFQINVHLLLKPSDYINDYNLHWLLRILVLFWIKDCLGASYHVSYASAKATNLRNYAAICMPVELPWSTKYLVHLSYLFWPKCCYLLMAILHCLLLQPDPIHSPFYVNSPQ